MMSFAAILVTTALAFAPSVPQTAVDFTGKWTGAFNAAGPDGSTREMSIEMNLEQKGKELTGTAGPAADRQWKILKGVVEGNTLTFEVQAQPDGIIGFVLTYSDGRLKGDATGTDRGEKRIAKIDVARAK